MFFKRRREWIPDLQRPGYEFETVNGRLTGEERYVRSAMTSSGSIEARTRAPVEPGRYVTDTLHSPKPATPPHATWLAAHETVLVAGYELPGLVYVGERLPGLVDPGENDACLIDPRREVASALPTAPLGDLGYWPRYARISPTQRAAYLAWLASGKSASGPVGFVFLYFYGLERRVLIDGVSGECPQNELAAIRKEVLRLIGGSGNQSFHRYATQFLDTLAVIEATQAESALPLLLAWLKTNPRTAEVSNSLRVALADVAARGEPLDDFLAAKWAEARSESRLRTAAQRCAVECQELFQTRLPKEFAAPGVLHPAGPELAFYYHAASSSIGDVTITVQGVTDEFDNEVGVTLASLWDRCVDDLDPYSRWLARNGDTPTSLEGVARLPRDLLEVSDVPAMNELRSWAARTIGDAEASHFESSELLGSWKAGATKLTRQESEGLAGVLEAIGYGIEPDVRYAGKALDARGGVLFRLPEAAEDLEEGADETRYLGAMLLVDLAAVVAAADGTISQTEYDTVVTALTHVNLSRAELRRLEARWMWMTQNSTTAGITSRVKALPLAQRKLLGEFLVALSALDDGARPSEIAALVKIYALLDLDPRGVYGRLHELAIPSDDPIVVRPVTSRSGGQLIPPAPGPATNTGHREEGGLVLDLELVARRIAESTEVAALLTDVFSDDCEVAQTVEELPKVSMGRTTDATIPGSKGEHGNPSSRPGPGRLDSKHVELIRLLTEQGECTWGKFASLCESLALLPEGALDTINEAALDSTGDPLCERSGDLLEIDADVAEELLT